MLGPIRILKLKSGIGVTYVCGVSMYMSEAIFSVLYVHVVKYQYILFEVDWP